MYSRLQLGMSAWGQEARVWGVVQGGCLADVPLDTLRALEVSRKAYADEVKIEGVKCVEADVSVTSPTA